MNRAHMISSFDSMELSLRPLWQRAAAWMVLCSMLFSPYGLGVFSREVHAGSIADPYAPIAFRPHVVETASGTRMVNIAAPNAAGISLNRYQRFDVDAAGLVLNNSLVSGGSFLGGNLTANPNFSGRPASLIINEVVSGHPSSLSGPLEVFGQAANVIIANPNGVSCSGCGFLNTGRVTLTTGRPVLLNGPSGSISEFSTASAVALDVRSGEVRIDGAGMSGATRFDLIAETLSVGGPVSASDDLNLIAGRQMVEDGSLAISSNGATNTATALRAEKPGLVYAIDAQSMGALQAGTIKIIATPAGLGVRSDGALSATNGDLVISANGDLEIKSAFTNRDLSLSGRNVTTSGSVTAVRNVSIVAPDAVSGDGRYTNNGSLDIGGNLQLTAHTFNNGSAASVAVGSVLNATVSHLENQGTLYGHEVHIDATALNNSGGFLLAGDSIGINAEEVDNAGGTILAMHDVRLEVAAGFNNNGGLLQANAGLSLLTPNSDFIVGDVTYGVLRAGTIVSLQVHNFDNNAAWIVGSDVHIEAGGNVHNSGTLQAPGDIRLLAGDQVLNSGILTAGGDVTLQGMRIDNAGLIDANRDARLTGAEIKNWGELIALRDVRIDGVSLDNSDSVLQAGRNLHVHVSGLLDNRGGALIAGGDLTFSAGTLDNDRQAPITTTQESSSYDPVVLNAAIMQPEHQHCVTGERGGQTCSTIPALRLGDLSPDYATLTATHTFTIEGYFGDTYVTRSSGLPFVTRTTTAQTEGAAGLISSQGNAEISVIGALHNRGSLIESGLKLTLQASKLELGKVADLVDSFEEKVDPVELSRFAQEMGFGAAYPHGTLTSHTTPGALGAVRSDHDLEFSLSDFINQGQVRAKGDFALNVSGNLENRNALAASGNLSLSATNFTNSGQVLAGQDLLASISDSFTNTAATLEAGRDLGLHAKTIVNQRGATARRYWNNWVGDEEYYAMSEEYEITPPGTLSAARDLDISGDRLENIGSVLTAGRNLSIAQSVQVDNRSRILTHTSQFSEIVYTGLFDKDRIWHGVNYSHTQTPAVVQASQDVTVVAPTQLNSGTIQGHSVYLGGDSITNGITDYHVQTPPPVLPNPVITLSDLPIPSFANQAQARAQDAADSYIAPGAFGFGAGASVPSRPGASPYLVSNPLASENLAPLTQQYLLTLLPETAKPSSGTPLPFFADPYVEQQLLKQAALKETGQSYFINGLAYDDQQAAALDTQQRLILYDNAVRAASADESLKLGFALSEAQREKLDAPMLWYVEQQVPDAQGNKVTALVPTVYLPRVTQESLIHIGGGLVRGYEIALDAKSASSENSSDRPSDILNTGFITAARNLLLQADHVSNHKRSADVGTIYTAADHGHLETTGDSVQPGGFMSAARMQIEARSIDSISGEFYEGGQEISAQLATEFAGRYSHRENQDHLHTEFIARERDPFETLVLTAVAVAISIYTAGAASAWLGTLAQAGTLGSTFAAGTATATAGLGNVMVSAAVGSMASSAVTGAVTGNLDFQTILESGMTAAITGFVGNYTGTWGLNGGEVADWGGRAAGWGTQAATQGAIASVRGDDFGGAFTNALISAAAAQGADFIGDHFALDQGSFGHVASHAALGAGVSALRGQDILSGALGGATSAFLSPWFDQYTSQDQLTRTAQLTVLSTLAGGIVAGLAGGDVTVGAEAARNEVQNNYLTHSQQAQRNKELVACEGSRVCQAQVLLRYGTVSFSQDSLLVSGFATAIPVTAYETLEGVAEIIADPVAFYDAMKELIANVDQLPGQLKQMYGERIDRMQAAYQAGGELSFDAGVEAGKMFTELASIAAGGAGLAKLTVKSAKLGKVFAETSKALEVRQGPSTALLKPAIAKSHGAKVSDEQKVTTIKGPALEVNGGANPQLLDRSDSYRVWKNENEIVGRPTLKEFGLFDDPSRTSTGFRAYANNEWPPNYGALGESVRFTLLPGTKIDRFGSDFGSFLSPTGTQYVERALRPGTLRAPYSVFEVTAPLEVEVAIIRPWFGEVGLGTQYKLIGDTRVKDLLGEQLKEVYRGPFNGYNN